jgi:AAA domain
MDIDAVVRLFPGGKWHGDEYETHCPCKGHRNDDAKPSLGISRGRDGRILLCCQKGHSLEEILAAVNLTKRDLAPANGNRPAEPEAVYRYCDEQGEPLFEKVRMPGKQFWQRLPGAMSGAIGEVRRVLFGLPELLATKPGETVAIVEGEKDVLNVRKRGVAATCNPEGASQAEKRSKWREEYTAWLKERLPGRRFVVFADQDEAGLVHADAVVASLSRAGLNVRAAPLSGLKEAEDISDWLARHTKEEFEELLRPPPPKLWARVLSFEQLLTQPSPGWLIDGLALEQTMVEWYGPPNEGKTFIVVDACMKIRQGGSWAGHAIDQRGPILYVSADGGLGFADRARAWAIVAERLPEDEEFWTLPEPVNLYRADTMAALGELIAYLPKPPKVLVIDTYSRCIPGVNENQQEFASMVVDNLTNLMREFKLSPWLVHHTDKTGQHERGSSVILGACDTQIRVSKAESIVSLKCEKQRDAPFFDPLYFDLGRVPATNETWVMWRPEGAPERRLARTEEARARIRQTIAARPGISRVELYPLLDLPESTLRRYLLQMIERAEIVEHELPREPGKEGAVRHGLFVVIREEQGSFVQS